MTPEDSDDNSKPKPRQTQNEQPRSEPTAGLDDDQLGEALGRAIRLDVAAGPDDADVGPPSVASIAERAEAKAKARRARQATGTIAASVVLVAGVAIGWSALREPAEDSLEATATPGLIDTAPAGEESAEPPPSEEPVSEVVPGAAVTVEDLTTGPVLEWTEVAGPPQATDSFGGRLQTVGDGRVSAAITRSDGASELFISDNGIDWTRAPLPEGVFPAQVDLSGDRWVVVGDGGDAEAFDSGDVGPPTVHVSDDEGVTWRELAVSLTVAETESPYITPTLGAPGLAVSGETVVLAYETFRFFDFERMAADRGLLPPDVTIVGYRMGGGEYTVEYAPDLSDPGAAISRTFTADELGLTEDERAAFEGDEHGQVQIFVSTGGDFELVHEIDGSGVRLAALQNGFVLNTFGRTGPSNFTSPDGFSWIEEEAVGFVDTVGAVGDVAWRSLWENSTYVVQRSESAGPWQTVTSFPALTPSDGMRVGPAGLAATAALGEVFETEPFEEMLPVSLVRDGYELRFNEPPGGLSLVELATGDPVLEFSPEQTVADEPPPGVVIDGDVTRFVDPETGDELLSFTNDEIEAAFEEALPTEQRAAGSGDFFEPETIVGWSSDGDAWGWETVADAFGTDQASFVQLAVGGDFVLASVQEFPRFEPGVEGSEAAELAETFEPVVRWFLAETP